ncbi:hypothetical protein ACC676_38635, partial [Rhizobium ruizarguesonis]
DFTDIFSGYRAFSRRFFKSFPAVSGGFEIETEMSVHASRLKHRQRQQQRGIEPVIDQRCRHPERAIAEALGGKRTAGAIEGEAQIESPGRR